MARSLAERLGFEADACVAIIHVDDIGMCHAANRGAFEALAAGPATCGSLMVPCPWFPEAAALAAARPGIDLGVHLTLNAEWDAYRWPPVAGAATVPSLVDDDGCLYRTLPEVLRNARVEEVEIALRAQIERALAEGLDVTHLDAHMGTALVPPLLEVYAKLMREYRLPGLVARRASGAVPKGFDALIGAIGVVADALEQEGFPVLDGFDQDSLSFAPGEGLAHNRRRLDGLRPGVHYLIIHAAALDHELAVLTPHAHCREFERVFYGGAAGRAEFERRGIRTIGMRALRDLVPR